jgi:hypothetical protein
VWTTTYPVDVENQIVLLGCGDSLDSDSIIKKFVGWKVFGDIFLDKFDSEIRVVSRFDTMTNTRNYNS